MRALRFSTVTTLTVVTAVVGCGGRTQQGRGDAPGEIVSVDDATNPPQSGVTSGVTSGPTGTSSVGTTPRAPTPSAPTNTSNPGTFVDDFGPTGPTGATGATGPTGATSSVVVSPSHPDNCPVPATVKQDAVAYTYSDGVTTIGVESTPGGTRWCASGKAGPSGDDYANWGAGIGAFVGYRTEAGIDVPFDAAERGIAGIRFYADVGRRPIRLMLTEINSPDIPEVQNNYESNAFIWGGSTPSQIAYNGSYEVRFDEIEQPAWSTLPEEFQRAFDASRLHSFQFLVPNTPNDDYESYTFCITDVEWVDVCGNAVAISLAAEEPPVIPSAPVPDPTSTAPDDTTPVADPTSSADVASLDPTSTETPVTSDVASDTGALEPVVDDTYAMDTSDVVDTAVEPPALDAGSP